MNIKCILGFHTWEGCICAQCGKTRDEQHNWDKDCEQCAKCGKTRDNKHAWNNCKCSQCGKIRDEQHIWEGCTCIQCGKTRDAEHKWEGCKCTICNVERDIQHSWDKDQCSLCGKIRCPKCGSTVTRVGSLFSKSGSGYGCTKCNWRRRYCGNRECKGYLEYVGSLSMYPGSVMYKCVKCDWGGSGVAFHDKDN